MGNKKELIVLPKVAKIIPEWILSELIDRNCPLCESDNNPFFIRSDRLPVSFCNACSLWYVAKVPSKNNLSEYYKNYFDHIRPTKFDHSLVKIIKRNTEKMLSVKSTKSIDVRILRLRALCENNLKGKRILEIGCGNGQFLHYLSTLSVDVVGCELSKEASDFINNKLGIKVFNGSLEENIGKVGKVGKVDIVIMNDVIEHLLNPQQTLEQIDSILSTGGLLLIWTPNGSEAGTNLETAIKWDGFNVDLEHLQYFSSNTIRQLANQFNYDIIHLESLGFPLVDKLVINNSSALKDFFKKLRYEFSCFMSQFTFYRAIGSFLKEFINVPNDRLGTYTLFSILRKL